MHDQQCITISIACINCHLYLLLGKSSLVTFEPFEVGELHLQLEFELESHFFAPSPHFFQSCQFSGRCLFHFTLINS